MKCPHCGKTFLQLPKLTTEVRIKLSGMMELLAKVDRELQRGELWEVMRQMPQQLWEMSTPLLYLKARGILYHPAEDGGKAIKFRWLVDQDKLKQFQAEIWDCTLGVF